MIYKNGEIRELTDAEKKKRAEIEKYQKEYEECHPPTPTEAERITQLEEELRAAKILLGLEV